MNDNPADQPPIDPAATPGGRDGQTDHDPTDQHADALSAMASGRSEQNTHHAEIAPELAEALGLPQQPTPAARQAPPTTAEPPQQSAAQFDVGPPPMPVQKRIALHDRLAAMQRTVQRHKAFIPPLAVMAGLMFILGIWTLAMIIAGKRLITGEPISRLKALPMLLTLPVGAFLAYGVHRFRKEITQFQKSRRNRQNIDREV